MFVGAGRCPSRSRSPRAAPRSKRVTELSRALSVAGRPAVALFGGDEAGLTAAAVVFAGRLPFLGDRKGPTTDSIAEDVKQFLASKGITGVASTQALLVKSGADGIDRATVEVQLSSGDFIKAQVAPEPVQGDGAARRQPRDVACGHPRVANPHADRDVGAGDGRLAAQRCAGSAVARAWPSSRRGGQGHRGSVLLLHD